MFSALLFPKRIPTNVLMLSLVSLQQTEQYVWNIKSQNKIALSNPNIYSGYHKYSLPLDSFVALQSGIEMDLIVMFCH
jgi:hypothetical protein